jgi:hypothetical protein
MAEHNSLSGSSLHEPKGIDSAGTSDAGKVVTPSATVAGQGTLRNLVESEINSKKDYLTLRFDTFDTVTDIYAPCPFAGTVDKVWTCIDGNFTGSDTTLTLKINGTNVTNGVVTVTQSGSAAGDTDSATPTANRTFNEGDYFQVTSDVAATSAVDAVIVLNVTRT